MLQLTGFRLRAGVGVLADGSAVVEPRPLGAIAATRGGSVPQARIRQVLADLMAPLHALHTDGKIHGGITKETVVLDEFGRAHLLAPLTYSPPIGHGKGLSEDRGGYSAFEQYVDDPAWRVGPWTDIYALSALMCALVCGQAPPSAVDRRARDEYVPLGERDVQGYDLDFLYAIDAGLVMAPAARPQSLATFAPLAGVPAAALTKAGRPRERPPSSFPQPDPVVQASSATATFAPASLRRPPASAKPMSWALICLVFMAAGGILYLWLFNGRDLYVPAYLSATANAPAVRQTDGPTLGQSFASTPASEVLKASVTGVASASGGESGKYAAGEATMGGPADTAIAPTSKTVKFQPAYVPLRVSVDIRPWGEVFINGASRGVSPPLRELKLVPGKYSVTVRNLGLEPYRTTIQVRPNRPASIAHSFP